jgi:hypothetical protein
MNMNVIKIFEEHEEIKHLGLKLRALKTADKNVDLLIKINDEKVFIEEKYEVRPNQVLEIRQQSEMYSNEIFLLAANYITPNAKKLLREYKINYMDSGGNVMLKLDNGLIFVEGKYVKSPSEQYKNRAFTKVGAKLIFMLLRNPKDVNLNYRSLSEISRCSLGSVSKIIDHLKEDKFIIKLPNDKMKLVQKEKLMNKWIEVLSNQLLPSMLIGRYNFFANTNWDELKLKEKIGFKWGGEVAASILTNNLRPQKFTIYTLKKSNEIIKSLKLVPNSKGKITIYKEFWYDEMKNETVHPLLVYAELMASNDSRNIEIAKEVKNRFLENDV